MTSLEFFPSNNRFQPKIPCDWGSGKSRKNGAGPPDDHAPSSWHYTNKPNEVPVYQVSILQLSNNRLNDELIPRPEHFDASKLKILRPFPAEHPYSSHISRFAIFPTAANNNTQKKGHQKVIVLQKTKGFDARIEKIVETEKDFRWPEIDSDHLPKDFGPPKTVYPIPPKLFLPNDDQPRPRKNDCYYEEDEKNEEKKRAVEDSAAETERKRWMTTYRESSLATLDQWRGYHLQFVDNKMSRLEQTKAGMNGTGPTHHTDYLQPQKKFSLTGREEDRFANGTKYTDDLPQNVPPSTLDPIYYFSLRKLHEFSNPNDSSRPCPQEFLSREKVNRKLSGVGNFDPDHCNLSLEIPSQTTFSCPGDTKTEIRRKFEQCFPSKTPALRQNSCHEKRHNFQCGINSQILRGATFVTG